MRQYSKLSNDGNSDSFQSVGSFRRFISMIRFLRVTISKCFQKFNSGVQHFFFSVVRNILLKYCYLIHNLGYILHFSVFLSFFFCLVIFSINLYSCYCHSCEKKVEKQLWLQLVTHSTGYISSDESGNRLKRTIRLRSVNYAFGLTRESDAQRGGQRTRKRCIKGR